MKEVNQLIQNSEGIVLGYRVNESIVSEFKNRVLRGYSFLKLGIGIDPSNSERTFLFSFIVYGFVIATINFLGTTTDFKFGSHYQLLPVLIVVMPFLIPLPSIKLSDNIGSHKFAKIKEEVYDLPYQTTEYLSIIKEGVDAQKWRRQSHAKRCQSLMFCFVLIAFLVNWGSLTTDLGAWLIGEKILPESLWFLFVSVALFTSLSLYKRAINVFYCSLSNALLEVKKEIAIKAAESNSYGV